MKRIAFYALMTFGVVVSATYIKYRMDITFEGVDGIHIIKETATYESLDEIVRLPAFRNKVVYVDLWFSSCTPCLKEFKALPGIKVPLKEAGVEFLYLGKKTSHPNSKQRWANVIREYDLEGWHLYMTGELYNNISELIDKNVDQHFGFPHYLLINRDGSIASYDAPGPSEKEALLLSIQSMMAGPVNTGR